MSDWTEMAETIVTAIRHQHWGILSVDRDDAVNLINHALQAAEASGAARGSRETGDSMLAAFDRLHPAIVQPEEQNCG